MPHGKNDAKKKMLGSLSKEMRDMMGENYGEGLKDKMMKVSVAGDSPEAVEKGLDKAEEILKKKIGPMEEADASEEEYSEDEEMMDMEDMPEEMHEEMYGETHEEMMEEESPEELKAKIEELQQKLAMLQGE